MFRLYLRRLQGMITTSIEQNIQHIGVAKFNFPWKCITAVYSGNSDKSATRSGLVGRYLTVLDLKTSCRALSASVRWAKAICRGSRVPQPMRNCHGSHVNKPLFKQGGDRFGPKPKRG